MIISFHDTAYIGQSSVRGQGDEIMYSIERLMKEIDLRNTAVFIGAGASRCSLISEHEIPDGKEMKLELYKYMYGKCSLQTLLSCEKKFKEEFGIKGRIFPELVWEKSLSRDGEKLTPHIKLLEEMFSYNKYIPPNYKFMAWLHLMDDRKINQVVTTNFDEKIEAAYHLLQSRGLFKDISVFTAADETDFRHLYVEPKNSRIIYKLHGTISRPYTIKASLTDMNKNLSKNKFATLKRIFENNSLVVFVGYACNDMDVFNALDAISADVSDVEIVWIKLNKLKSKSNISKILELFDSKQRVLELESYSFFKYFFDSFVNREKININLIDYYINFIKNKVIEDTKDTVLYVKKKPIYDVLYEKIEFPEKFRKELFKIINTFDMQRLRDVKQLSFAQYRYPSATHTRFSHSLGVAYLVSKALSGPLGSTVSEEDKKNTIYAALLHDVGHGPLGHVLDKFYDRLEKDNEHEKFTKEFIDKGLIDLSDILKEININFEYIKNTVTFKSENPEEMQRNPEKLFLSWLITDYALDLDRIDFLSRDLLMTQYPFFSKLPSRLQKNIVYDEWKNGYLRSLLNDIIDDFVSQLRVADYGELVEKEQNRFPENARILYVDNKGKYNLDQLINFFLDTYTNMYADVYYNDIVSSAEAMLAKALHIAYENADIDRSRLYIFTDSELFSYLENLENDLVREIVISVKHRRLFRPVVEFNINTDKNLLPLEIERKIVDGFKLNQNDFKSIVIAHVPRKKKLRNLFIKKDNKIISYPNLEKFEEILLNNTTGKIFVHPKNILFKNKNELLDILKEFGLDAIDSALSKQKKSKKIEKNRKTSLDPWL